MSQCGNWQKYQNRNPLQRLLIRRFVNVVIEMTAPLTFAAVLDAGSGEGFVSQRLLQARPSIQVIGVDIDKRALERGRGMHPDIVFQFGDVTDLPFEANSFDLVICNDTGVMHVSAAVGARTLAIFGPTDPGRWAPRTRRLSALRAPDGQLEKLEPKNVVQKAVEILGLVARTECDT